MFYAEGVKAELYRPDTTKKVASGVTLSYELLMGGNEFSNAQKQVELLHAILDIVKNMVLMAWERIDTLEKYPGSYIKITQSSYEPYTQFQGGHKTLLKY